MVSLPVGDAQADSTEIVLYAFSGGNDGGVPVAGLVRDRAGNLYGTTEQGGTRNAGTVFKVTTAGTETVLHSFTGRGEGGGPLTPLLKNRGGLYGTTSFGGGESWGTIFDVTRTGHLSVVHRFAGSDGEYSAGGLIADKAGNLYGTAEGGGGSRDAGTVYKFTPAGFETLLHVFAGGSDGAAPRGNLILDEAGNLYGTTAFGGAGGMGTVFEITAAGKERVLYAFTDGNDGGHPFAGLTMYMGSLYGTTYDGGAYAYGTVFRVVPGGAETALHSFTAGADGGFPETGLIAGKAGDLYGTTVIGGAYGAGTVFAITPQGAETVLHSFAVGSDGAGPEGDLIMDGAGNLYGTTTAGGKGYGTVFEIRP